ncbi:MAG: hypothetical protein ACOZBW_03505 [Thermodesulfobacteriota bacterium]
MNKKLLICAAAALVSVAACTHKVQVEPIHITVDINIKVDKALDDFFSDLDAPAAPAPAAAPASAPDKK